MYHEPNYYMENQELRDYFITLAPVVKKQVLDSGVEISTLGELKMFCSKIENQIKNND